MMSVLFMSAMDFKKMVREVGGWVVIFIFYFLEKFQLCKAPSYLLLFGRSCVIVSHHRLTDELFPAAAVFGWPYVL